MKTNTNSFKSLSTKLYELLKAERYSESTMRDTRFILHSMSNYVETYRLDDYSPEIGKRFVAYCVNDLRICSSRISRAKNIVGKLNRLQQGLDGRDALLPDLTKRFELPDNLMTPLQEYLVYCEEKGNRQSTIDCKHWICNRFLKNLLELGCTEIRELTGENVQAAFLALGAIRYWERIGPFLQFLADSNYLKQNYSGLIQRRRPPMPQPTVYSPEEISIIENSFDMCSPAGIRNYAITLLMSRYGIRACDVAVLTFDNIDFENSRLRFIQQKTDDPWEGELFPEIKSALQRYINKHCQISKAHYQNFCSKQVRLLFEKVNREAPFAGLLGVSSNNGFPQINQIIRSDSITSGKKSRECGSFSRSGGGIK